MKDIVEWYLDMEVDKVVRRVIKDDKLKFLSKADRMSLHRKIKDIEKKRNRWSEVQHVILRNAKNLIKQNEKAS